MRRARAAEADDTEGLRRLCMRYEGHVQGVGFRYMVCRVAEGFPVTGYVRNEWDGSVRLVVEGQEQAILGLLGGIRQSPVGRYIVAEQAVWESPQGVFSRFGVQN